MEDDHKLNKSTEGDRDKFRKERDDYDAHRSYDDDREYRYRKDRYRRDDRHRDSRSRRDDRRSYRRDDRRSRDISPPPKRQKHNDRDRWHKRDRRGYGGRMPPSQYPFSPMHGSTGSHYPRLTQEELFSGSVKPYKQWLEAQPDDITPTEAAEQYNKYKEEFNEKQCKLFFDQHKEEEWFKEFYDPAYIIKEREANQAKVKERYDEFVKKLEEGSLPAFDLSYKEEIKQNSSNDQRILSDSKDDNDEKASEKVDATKENSEQGENTEKPSKDEDEAMEEGETKEEETIADQNKENKQEDKEEKKEEQTDAENTSAEKQDDDSKVAENVNKLNEESNTKNNSTLYIKNVPASWPKEQLVSLLNSVDNCKVVSISFSPPNAAFQYGRMGWVTFENEEQAIEVLSKLNGATLLENELCLAMHKPNTNLSGPRIAWSITANKDRIAKDYEICKKVTKALDTDFGIESNCFLDDASFEETGELVGRLDKLISYLRYVHCYCYYCGSQFDASNIQRKCGTIHIRGKENTNSTEPSPKEAEWLANLDAKNEYRANRVKYGWLATWEKDCIDCEEKFYDENIEGLNPERFKCNICKKQFKGRSFVVKHINNKHPTLIHQKAIEKRTFENYKNDPVKLLPPAQPAMNHMFRGMHSGPMHPPPMQYGSPFSPMPPPMHRHSRNSMGNGNSILGNVPLDSPYNNHRRRDDRPRPRLDPRDLPAPDPRELPVYVDLDAPQEKVTAIDYRTQIVYDD